ncbi:MAG TPA: hypothetical protein VFK22_03585 [Candidatus Dormibacteraeota bacterium]|nr:hypothetical protein [Candidatus Dormibacteraeota bacterium]
MRARGAIVIAAFVLAGCGGSTPTAAHVSPTTSTAPATASASASTGTTPASTPTSGPPSLVHCAGAVPAGDNLVIGTVVGDPTVVVRDIQDPANAKNVCTFDASAQSPLFISGTSIAYENAANQIIKADVASGATTVLAAYSSGGQYAISPDGSAVTYLDGGAWHLAKGSTNKLLTTLPAVPARGIDPSQDDLYLSFSPDGNYVALFQTLRTGGSGETAADQIRKASDGSLVYSTSGMTMAVWASVPSRLFFRDMSGNVHRWDPSSGLSSMTTLHWIRPRSSPDGRWIAYTFPTTSGVDGVGFYSVQANSQQNTSPPGRSGAVFLTNDLVWYAGEKPCSTCFGGLPTASGVTYIYSIAGASEITSRLASVNDAWPRVTAPGL